MAKFEDTAFAIGQLPLTATTKEVIDHAQHAQNPRDISPGIYPVVFAPVAFATLFAWTIWNLDARAADEGRSFMSRMDANGQPIGNRVGESLFSQNHESTVLH